MRPWTILLLAALSMPLLADAAAARYRSMATLCSAAKDGDANAALQLGKRYLTGRGVQRNAAMGAAWIQRAAELGKPWVRRLVPDVVRIPRPDCNEGGGRRVARATPSPEIVAIVRDAAARHGLDSALVVAVMQIESGFDPKARSPKGAMGLMQLMPGTARRFAVADPWDPAQNVNGGCAYLRFLLDRYDGDVKLAAAAYNAGEGAVDKHGGVPPYAETRAYVRMLAKLYPHAKVTQIASTTEP